MSLFSPKTVERICATVAQRVDGHTCAVFRRCFTDTLSRTIEELPDGTAFVVTGDIPAMWLRDSSAQLTPYLHFLRQDPHLCDTVAAVARRQLRYVLLDPYANAFNAGPSGAGPSHDAANTDPWVWERKYEIDSLCYPVQLAHDLWRITGRTDHLIDFVAAAQTIISLWRTEQDHQDKSSYTFPPVGGAASPGTLGRDGRDPAVGRTGMTWSGFRPSDDACGLGFNIPGNMFAVVELTHIAEIAAEVFGHDALVAAAAGLRQEIENGIRTHAIVTDAVAGDIYAYEVDGLGNYLLMDDANVPSLLSLPLLGWCQRRDPLYVATRAFLLTGANPYYHRGLAASGQGSPHTPPGTIWPIALAVEGLTALSEHKKAALLATLVATDAGTGLMHESFHKDDPQVFTRAWFSWANAMFCELVLDVVGLRTYTRAPIARVREA
jgi:hypothetical protein